MRVGENITHRADGRWEARYIKGRNPNGSAIYGFCYGKTYDEAVRKRDDAQLLSKNAVVKQPKTFGEIYSMLGGAEFGDTTARLAERLVLPMLETTPINSVSDSDLAAIMRELKRKCSSDDIKYCFDLIKRVFEYAVAEDYLPVLPIGELTMRYRNGRKTVVTKGFVPITEQEILTFEQAKELERRLIEGTKTKNFGIYVGLYLCLELGLLRTEVGALQLKDIDFEKRTLSVNKILAKQLKNDKNAVYDTASVEQRIIPLPKYVFDFLTEIRGKYSSAENFIVCGKNGAQCAAKEYSRELRAINAELESLPSLEMKTFRDTFIVRCIKNGIDIFTISELTGIRSIADIQSRYGELFKAKTETICSLESYENGTHVDRNEPEKLNLLILGAGGYGHTVKEIAEKIGVFDKIAFLDDNTSISEAIDICANFKRYRSTFPCAFPAFGDCELRKHWIDIISENGFSVPRLIDPSASISPSAVISDAVVIESNATINAQTNIGRGCIISSNALIDRGAVLAEAVHADSSSTITKDSFVPALAKVQSGSVFDSSKI